MSNIAKCVRCFSKLTDTQINLMKKGLPKRRTIEGVDKIVLVSSAKGGVGKSTVAANLAISLLRKTPNKTVGILDADVFGPSQPILFNLAGMNAGVSDNGMLQPLTNYGVQVMSMGFLIDSSSAVVWRGLMVMSAIERLLYHVYWGQLDCLIIDLPPGTGDVSLTLCQRLPINGAVLVTTPQHLAIADVRRGLKMFRTMNIPVLGFIKNMSYFQCPCCQNRYELFGKCEAINSIDTSVEELCEFPIEERVSNGSDTGQPVTVVEPNSSISQQYNVLAETLWNKIK